MENKGNNMLALEIMVTSLEMDARDDYKHKMIEGKTDESRYYLGRLSAYKKVLQMIYEMEYGIG